LWKSISAIGKRWPIAVSRVNVLSLGRGFGGDVAPIDRERCGKSWVSQSVAANSLDVSSDRDFILEFVFDLTTIALHLAGWAEEWILWSTTEFNFLELPDAFCTGSSIMPHKKNPDVLELIRGKSARVAGALQQLVGAHQGIAAGVQSRFARGQGGAFRRVDTVAGSLELAAARSFVRRAFARRIMPLGWRMASSMRRR